MQRIYHQYRYNKIVRTSFCVIIPNHVLHIIIITTIEIYFIPGGAQSTLQDIKVPDCAGGFVYGDTGRVITRNRFISWRTSHDVSTYT